MDSFTNQQSNIYVSKLIDVYQNFFFTIINLNFSLLQLLAGFLILFLTSEFLDTNYLKFILLLYCIINSLFILVYGTRLVYLTGLITPPNLIFIKLLLYELWCRVIKIIATIITKYLFKYEFLYITQHKFLFYTLCFILVLDLISFGTGLMTFCVYLTVSSGFVKTEKYKKIKCNVDMIFNNEECAICLEDYILHQELVNLKCDHKFHESCIKQWFIFNKVCPTCKTNMWIQIELNDQKDLKL